MSSFACYRAMMQWYLSCLLLYVFLPHAVESATNILLPQVSLRYDVNDQSRGLGAVKSVLTWEQSGSVAHVDVEV